MEKAEDLQIMVRYKGKELYRNYGVVDGQAPQAASNCIQDMMDVIKNAEYVPF